MSTLVSRRVSRLACLRTGADHYGAVGKGGILRVFHIAMYPFTAMHPFTISILVAGVLVSLSENLSWKRRERKVCWKPIGSFANASTFLKRCGALSIRKIRRRW